MKQKLFFFRKHSFSDRAIFSLNLLFLFFFFTLFTARAQPELDWTKCYGGSGEDDFHSMLKDVDNTIIALGESNSPDGMVKGHHGWSDVWFCKINLLGDTLWTARCFGGDKDDVGEAIVRADNGGYVIAGWTASQDNGDVSGFHGDGDVWLFNTDSTGENLIWQNCIGGTDGEFAYDVMKTSDGNLVVVGETRSVDGDIPDHIGNMDFLVVKTDAGGNIKWIHCFGGTHHDEAYAVCETYDGAYAITGYTQSNDIDVSGNHNEGTKDVWLIKVDSTGNLLWGKCYGGTKDDWAKSIIATPDSGFILLGSAASNDGDVTGWHRDITPPDYWVIKVDKDGNILWNQCYGGTKWDEGFAIQQKNNGGYLLSGYTYSSDGDVTGKISPSTSNSDYWVASIDETGTLEWNVCIGSTAHDFGYDILEMDDGSVIVGGSTIGGYPWEGEFGNGYTNDFGIAKLSSGLIINENAQKQAFTLYPVPAGEKLFLHFQQEITEPVTVKIYSSSGRLVFHKKMMPSGRKLVIPLQNENAGIYYLSIHFQGNVYTKSFVKYK